MTSAVAGLRLSLLLLAPLAAAAQPAQAQRALPSGFEQRVAAEVLRLVDGAPAARVVPYEGRATPGTVEVLVADPALIAGGAGRAVVTRPDALARDLSALRAAFATSVPSGALGVLVRPDLASGGGARVAQAAADAGFGRTVVLPAAVGAMPDDLTAVYLDAGTGLSEAETEALLRALAARGIPVFAASPDLVRLGALASASPAYETRLVREAALAVQDRTEGLRDVPLVRPLPPVRFTLNARVARTLGLAVPWGLRLEADLVDDEAASVPTITLGEAVRESADRALAVRAEAFAVRADQQDVALARSRLLPQVNALSDARVVNPDLGRAALGGANPERLVTLEARVFQTLFNESAFAGVAAARRVAVARGYQLAAARLDAAQQGADAFIDLLRAQTGAQIERATLERTRTNLEAARLRQRVGTGGPADVARLESEAAQTRSRLAGVLGGAEAARVALNAALNRPLGAPLETRVGAAPSAPARLPEALGDTVQSPIAKARAVAAEALAAVVDRAPASPEAAAALADRSEALALERAPEALALRSLLSARERSLLSARRARYLPELNLVGGVGTRLYEGGAGTEPPPPQLPIAAFPNETYQVGLSLSFPLFAGGRRSAQVRQARAQVGAAQAQLDLVRQGVATGARASAERLSANAAAFDQSLDAAAAAAESYRIVQALYREGLTSLLDVLDAQTGLRVAEQLAAQAAYDVAEAAIGLQRATGSFDALPDPSVTDPDAVLGDR